MSTNHRTSTTGSENNIQTIYKCDHCHDTGWILEERPGHEYEGCYSYPLTFAIPCKYCRGVDPKALRDINGVPQDLKNVTYDRFNWEIYENYGKDLPLVAEGFQNDYRSIGGLYVWSQTCGSGKTRLLSSLLNSVMLKEHITGQFVTEAEYLEACKANFNRQPEAPDHTKKYFNADLLIIDDIGTTRKREWADEVLFSLINYRYSQGKITCYTSNIPLRELKIDSRIIDRMYSTTITLHMPEETVRSKLAQQKKAETIRKLREGAASQ